MGNGVKLYEELADIIGELAADEEREGMLPLPSSVAQAKIIKLLYRDNPRFNEQLFRERVQNRLIRSRQIKRTEGG